MYTKVEYEELVKETLSRIGKDLGAQFDKPSASDVWSYPRGKWLYETDGPSVMEVQIYRSGNSEKRGAILGCQWNEERGDYERRLDTELRAAALKLVRLDEHDEGCAGCSYELRRKLKALVLGLLIIARLADNALRTS